MSAARRASRRQPDPGGPRRKRILELARATAEPRYQAIAARLLPLTDEQKERLSLLLHPGGRHDAA